MKPLLMIGIVGLVSFLPVSEAEAARRCPSGTILRVSKNVCVQKAYAFRAGIYRPRAKRSRIAFKHRLPRIAPKYVARTSVPVERRQREEEPQPFGTIPNMPKRDPLVTELNQYVIFNLEKFMDGE